MANHTRADKVVKAEYMITMDCNACARRVAKAISKLKGVEKFMTGMTDDRVVVIGRINPEKVLKKLKKKMGKKVELVVNEDQDDEDGDEKENNCSGEEGMGSWLDHYYGDGEIHMMFSDENANSCTMM
ncbi:heavy metal-associated isoprenylated plant protein 19-like [Salvia hispanica]|uniref:heavy metal-associated isoprenylated plant protein 19-like n=1 Tax=Salvia hispanica TaxID=49212 RepID=UPI002009C670|nr:heavy metal-associated isoprenylated plant protein 19-like [Salvia hispanica]